MSDERDHIDRWLAEHELPGAVDYEVEGIVDRINGLRRRLNRMLNETLSEIAKAPKVLILRMKHVPAIDATGIHALEQMAKKCRHQGTTLILTEIQMQPLRAIVRAGKLAMFGGRQNLAKSVEIALERAREVIGSAPAAT